MKTPLFFHNVPDGSIAPGCCAGAVAHVRGAGKAGVKKVLPRIYDFQRMEAAQFESNIQMMMATTGRQTACGSWAQSEVTRITQRNGLPGDADVVKGAGSRGATR